MSKKVRRGRSWKKSLAQLEKQRYVWNTSIGTTRLILNEEKRGTFLLRKSSSDPNCWVIAVKRNNQVEQYKFSLQRRGEAIWWIEVFSNEHLGDSFFGVVKKMQTQGVPLENLLRCPE